MVTTFKGLNLSKSPLSVLLVVDHASDRLALAEALEVAGFAVLEAADSDTALTTLKAHDKVSIMVAEIDIPGSINGARLALAVGERWPSVAIIVIASKSTLVQGIPERCYLIESPYERNNVIAAVRAKLEGQCLP